MVILIVFLLSTELRINVHKFLLLVEELRSLCHLEDNKHVSLKKKIAIFLYCKGCKNAEVCKHHGDEYQARI